MQRLTKDVLDVRLTAIEVSVPCQTLLQSDDLLPQHIDVLSQIFNHVAVLEHESIRMDNWGNLMFVLLFGENSLDKLSALHLESHNVRGRVNPSGLRCFVPLAILVILVVRHFSSKDILPCFIEV